MVARCFTSMSYTLNIVLLFTIVFLFSAIVSTCEYIFKIVVNSFWCFGVGNNNVRLQYSTWKRRQWRWIRKGKCGMCRILFSVSAFVIPYLWYHSETYFLTSGICVTRLLFHSSVFYYWANLCLVIWKIKLSPIIRLMVGVLGRCWFCNSIFIGLLSSN